MASRSRVVEKALAVASFTTATALAFVSLIIRTDHDLTANIILCVAQFLTLTATILGINLKFNTDAKD